MDCFLEIKEAASHPKRVLSELTSEVTQDFFWSLQVPGGVERVSYAEPGLRFKIKGHQNTL